MGLGEYREGTIKRVSLVRLRDDLPRRICLERWAAEHADLVRGLTGIREYTVDLSRRPRTQGDWDAIATLRFADETALHRFEDDPNLQERLRLTRDDFAVDADAFLVDEHHFIPPEGTP